MDHWKQRLQDASAALLQAVGELLPPSKPRNACENTVRIVNALSDVLQIAEAVADVCEKKQRSDAEWRQRTEARILALEAAPHNINASESHKQTEGRKRTACRVDESRQNEERAASRGAAKRPRCAETGLGDAEERRSVVDEDATEEMRGNVGRESEKLKELKQRRQLYRPSLPTLADVRQELAAAERERHDRERVQPPPCAKCRCRKRADMLRSVGYIDEEKFEKWAVTPGACLLFMHQDDPLPMNDHNNTMTFDASQTQSPGE